ncbi:MAG: DUF6588 family protein [Candidatus Cloacimonas sp.]|jgi:hypothetical protein|nr:hypothetical protein [Candidatus Cloacimonadota bacterium]
MRPVLIVLALLLTFNGVYAQNVQDNLQQMAAENGKGYMKPFVTAFGTNLNTGLYNTAAVAKPSVLRPVRFGIHFNTMLAFVPEVDRTFDAAFPSDIFESVPVEAPETIETATVFGKEGGKFMGERILPNGINLKAVPLIVPQAKVSLPLGNELMLRFMPPVDMGDFGELNFWGVGLKHSIDQYIPLFPVHLAVQGAYQQFSAGDIVEVTSWAANAQVSKTLLMLTVYGGIGIEGSSLKADYEYQPIPGVDPIPVKFEIDGDNDFRMTAGVRWALLPFIHVNADYSIAKYQVLNLGFGLSF